MAINPLLAAQAAAPLPNKAEPVNNSGEKNCPPKLSLEGTIKPEDTKIREGRPEPIITISAEFTFDLIGKGKAMLLNDAYHYFPEDRNFSLIDGGAGWCGGHLTYRCEEGHAPYLDPVTPSSKQKKEKLPPVVSGVGSRYIRPIKDLTQATHVQIGVFSLSKGFVILEIYESDDPRIDVEDSKNPKNHWLPGKDVDLFKVRIPVEPSRKWQTFTVPLPKFIDWNRKRTECSKSLPGLNENVGDGILNLKPKESFQFQIILEAEDYGKSMGAKIGRLIKFIRYESSVPKETPK